MVVFSTTLDRVDWNSRLVRDNIADEIARLKELPGKDLSVGGATLASAVLRLGLIDEFRPHRSPRRPGRRHAILPGPGGQDQSAVA